MNSILFTFHSLEQLTRKINLRIMICFCLRQDIGVRRYSKTESHDFHFTLKQTWVLELTGHKSQRLFLL